MASTSFLKNLPDQEHLMPVLFVGHGNPMNAVYNNHVTKSWEAMVGDIPTPKAILCISAHWETRETKIHSLKNPRVIYDVYGFPEELYKVKYPCPGSPDLAHEVMEKVNFTTVHDDHEWGIDHGTWSILVKMFPDATIPCLQLSLKTTRDLQWHYDLAKELSFLRQKGVLIVGSGNIVHNLQLARFGGEPYDWALDFDEKVKESIDNKSHDLLINYKGFGKPAELSVNSAEHYIPLLYALALQRPNESIQYFNEIIDFGSGGMRSLKIGA